MSNVIPINRPIIDKLKAALDTIKQCCKVQPDYNAVFIDNKGFYFFDKVRPGTGVYEFEEMPIFQSVLDKPSDSVTIKRVTFRFYELVDKIAVFKQDSL